MALMAKEDQRKRSVEVNRLKLVETLETNREKHIREYNEAIEGYRSLATEKLQQAYEQAKLKLDRNLERGTESLKEFDPSNPSATSDYLVLVEGVNVHLQVPRNYSKEYDAAIDMAKWDVRETLELTHAEFQCFVRDEWEWTGDFASVSAIYNKRR